MVVPMAFFAMPCDGDITLSSEHTEIVWLPYEEAERRVMFHDQKNALYELCERDVVSVKNGANLGRVDDLRVDETTARVQSLVIYGRLKWFGLLGREEDLSIPWEEIVTIGSDVVLVNTDLPPRERKLKKFLKF